MSVHLTLTIVWPRSISLADFFILCGVRVLRDTYDVEPYWSLLKTKRRFAVATNLKNPLANRKQTLVISLQIKLARHVKNLKTLVQPFSGHRSQSQVNKSPIS